MFSCKNKFLAVIKDLKWVGEPNLIRQGVPEPRSPDRESLVTLSSQPLLTDSQQGQAGQSQVMTGIIGSHSCAMYVGASPCWALKVNKRILKSILRLSTLSDFLSDSGDKGITELTFNVKA